MPFRAPTDSLITSVVALARYPNFLKEMEAQAERFIKPLAGLAGLHNGRVGTHIKVRTKKLNETADKLIRKALPRDQPLTDAVKELTKRLLGVGPSFVRPVIFHVAGESRIILSRLPATCNLRGQ
jgi:hypothetical protein